MASPTDAALIGGLIVTAGVFIPFYNAFMTKAKSKKDQDDQFHSRINEGVIHNYKNEIRVARLEGYNAGLKDGKAEVRAELKQ